MSDDDKSLPQHGRRDPNASASVSPLAQRNTAASASSPAQPTRVNLEQQRKRAKELLKAFRDGDASASERVRRHLPDASTLKLAQAQWVVAREAGFDSWARLKSHAVQARQSRAQLVSDVLSSALTGHHLPVETALALAPDLSHGSPFVAAALADEPALISHLDATTDHATRAVLMTSRGGPHGFSILGYLCHARIGRESPTIRQTRGRLAQRLIASGADAKECVDTYETPGGKLSLLAAAARHTASAELVEVLLDAGAELEPPGSTAGPPAPPLVAAAMGGNLECVKRLIAAGAPGWQAREALEIAVLANDAAMARALLEYGASPDHAGRWQGRNGGCVHAALLLGCDAQFLEVLLEGGATVRSRDRDGRSPLRVAVQLDAGPAIIDLLVRHGASLDEVDASDELIRGCVAGDADQLDRLAKTNTDWTQRASVSDQQMVCWAVRQGRHAVLERLLAVGFDPNIRDDGGETPLHLAIEQRDTQATRLLVRHGASARARDYENTTALERALAEPDAETRRAMLECLANSDAAGDIQALFGIHSDTRALGSNDSDLQLASGADLEDYPEVLSSNRQRLAAAFEDAVNKMTLGDLDGLRTLLDQTPELVTARSPRYHRATLLHYLSSNGTESVVTPPNAGAMAELLIERGADVNASCRMYGGGPHQDTLGLVATSGFPEEAGLMDDLIGALIRGGALRAAPTGKNGALAGAILYVNRAAVRALTKHGVRPHDLPSAAAVGEPAWFDAALDELTRNPTIDAKARDNQLIGALGNAASFGHLPILERLLALGVDINARGDDGATALHKAAWGKNATMVRWLLDNGANPTLKDYEHQGTPAGWAWHAGAKELAEFLKSAEQAFESG